MFTVRLVVRTHQLIGMSRTHGIRHVLMVSRLNVITDGAEWSPSAARRRDDAPSITK